MFLREIPLPIPTAHLRSALDIATWPRSCGQCDCKLCHVNISSCFRFSCPAFSNLSARSLNFRDSLANSIMSLNRHTQGKFCSAHDLEAAFQSPIDWKSTWICDDFSLDWLNIAVQALTDSSAVPTPANSVLTATLEEIGVTCPKILSILRVHACICAISGVATRGPGNEMDGFVLQVIFLWRLTLDWFRRLSGDMISTYFVVCKPGAVLHTSPNLPDLSVRRPSCPKFLKSIFWNIELSNKKQ